MAIGTYLAAHLVAQNPVLDPQHQNMGLIEFLGLERFLPVFGPAGDSTSSLIIAMQDFKVPGRSVGSQNLPYMNVNTHYPTRAEPLGDVTVTFRDFVTSPARAVLQAWHAWVYNEITSWMAPMPLLKTVACAKLFNTIGALERTVFLYGIWPTKAPGISVSMGSGDIMTMEMSFKADHIVWGWDLYGAWSQPVRYEPVIPPIGVPGGGL